MMRRGVQSIRTTIGITIVLGAVALGCDNPQMEPLPDLPPSAKQTTVTPHSGPVTIDVSYRLPVMGPGAPRFQMAQTLATIKPTAPPSPATNSPRPARKP